MRTTPDGIAYDVAGSGPVVVLIHGYPLDRSAWSDVAEILSVTCRVINPDLRGFGASPWPTDGDLSMDRHADDIAALLDLEEVTTAAIVGLSMGGYVALAVAQRYPERLSALGLVGSKTEPDSAEGRAGRDTASRQILTEGRSSIVAGLQSALLGPDAAPSIRARLRTMIEATPYETYVSALIGMRDRPDRTLVLDGLDVPLAVVVGEHDTLVPADVASDAAHRARNGVLTVVAGAGHLVPMEAPAEVATALTALIGV